VSRRAHTAIWGAVLLAGVALRVALFSGYGLGDDSAYFWCYGRILRSGTIDPQCAYDFRFAFWIPVVGAMRLFGVSEASWVGFVTLCSCLNVVLVWLLARQDGWERPAALAAMALMAVLPLEVLCATLFVIDVPLATYCFGAFWLYRAALAAARRPRRLAFAAAAGVGLFLAYSTKQWAVLVGILFAVEGLRDPRRTWAASAVTLGGFATLVGGYFAWQWARFGDPYYDIRLVRSVAAFLPHDPQNLLDYPRMLFLPNELGLRFAGFYPHALALLALVYLRRRAAARWPAYFLVLLVALAAMPSHRDAQGRWLVLVPHIFRYLCFVSIPLCLALGAYVRELLRGRRAVGLALLAAFLGASAGQAVVLAAPTRDSFAEQRRALVALRAFPEERVWADVMLAYRFASLELRLADMARVGFLRAETPAARADELAHLRDGIVVTGGARLPWYGCHRCTANLGDLPVPPSWVLLAALEGGPRTIYRTEPLRIWRVAPAAAEAAARLAVVRDPAARRTLLRDLVRGGRDDALAFELGERLLAAAPRDAEVAYLTGLAAFRSGRARDAVRRLAPAVAAGLDPAALRVAIATLARAAALRGDWAAARAAVRAWRRRLPDVPPDQAVRDVETGLAEAIHAYHHERLSDALGRFTALAGRDDLEPVTRQRAAYFTALTLFRLGRTTAAAAVTEDYRRVHGPDASWQELRYRYGHSLRATDPAAARAVWSALAAEFPDGRWSREAARQAAALP
jgi:hypothetical protein